MKEFIKAFKYVLLYQLICWGVFILFDEIIIIPNIASDMVAIISSIFLLIGLLILYLIYENKIIMKNNLNRVKFNICLYIIWIIISILISTTFINMVDKGYFHVCHGSGWECFLSGIEYGAQGILLVLLVILIILIKIIIKIYKFITKSEN